MSATSNSFVIRRLGLQPYGTVWQQMRDFTDARTENTADEIWLVEHSPVYTQGQAGKPEHLLNPQNIPVVSSDRGGQVTYHGPGQLVVYPLLNLRRRKLGVRDLVTCIEQAVIRYLAGHDIAAVAKADAPGVYVQSKKIASLGLRVRKGCSYHGVALNVDMDLAPFLNINPCGYQGLEMTQLSEWVAEPLQYHEVETHFLRTLIELLQQHPQ
ncbi:lipoyl(octanoyl) transferase LipB [Teredinibacter purpureus]|uniref:lipoyl(octanoyl) transferase LipB n=1 Tax=Teredinibacter purpureus TaxID=2731756 RepID=UPI0005F7E396|nr:lipoyl(octanoyl) transferase LipB [Teredinibacter purpureus]